MRQDHVIDEDIGAVVRLEVPDHRRGRVREAAVYDVDPEAGVVAVAQADRVTVAVANGQEVDFVMHQALNSGTPVRV